MNEKQGTCASFEAAFHAENTAFKAVFRAENSVFKASMEGPKRTATLAINGNIVPLGANVTINGETYYVPGTEES